MKKIILVSENNPDDPTIADLSKLAKYNLLVTKNAGEAMRLIKRHAPKFVLCAGKIRQKEDGRYVLDLS